MEKYIHRKQTFKDVRHNLAKSFRLHWDIPISITVGGLIFLIIDNLVSTEILRQQNSTIIAAASIIVAIVITFLIAKVIQLRQEKLSRWLEYRQLTIKINHFRAAVLPLLEEQNFWANGTKSHMDYHYKHLTYYEIRKQVFVDGTPISDLGRKYNEEDDKLKRFYLELRTLFGRDIVLDSTILDSEFPMPQNYKLSTLELWAEFECGSGFWKVFEDKYWELKDGFNFNAIKPAQIAKIMTHCIALDKARYGNASFGPQLYVKLGQQFTDSLLPDLYRLSHMIEPGNPPVIKQLLLIMQWITFGGILIPLFVSMQLLGTVFTTLSIATMLASLTFLSLSLGKMLDKEIDIYGPDKRWHKIQE